MLLYVVLFCIAQHLHAISAIPLGENDDNSVAYLINEHKVEKRQLLLRGLEREIRRDDRLMDRMINQEFRDERIMNNQLRRDERFMRDTMIPFGGGLYNDPFIQPIGGFYY